MRQPLDKWQQVRANDLDEEVLWETFHENSKTGRHDLVPIGSAVVAQMQKLHESLPFDGYPRIALPREWPPPALSLNDAIARRTTARELGPCPVQLQHLAALLFNAYGVTRDNSGTSYVRAFRTVPSGGGLYPLELFFHARGVSGLEAGLYHYDAAQHCLRLLRVGDRSSEIAACLVQPELAERASIVVFLTALFERSTFKYRDRGYRFVLLEAGHVAQNINLSAVAYGYGVVNVGGFFDREVDAWLGLDGVEHSTVYLNVIGQKLGA